MTYLFLRDGIILIEATPEAAIALREHFLSLVDDGAVWYGHKDDANALLDVAQGSLNIDLLKVTSVIGGIAYSGAVIGVIAAVAAPIPGTTLGLLIVGLLMDKFYQELFKSTVETSNRAGEAAFQIWGASVDPSVNTAFLAAKSTPPRRDPLVLDLDGDGLELVNVNKRVLFDHNADGIRTAREIQTLSELGIDRIDLHGTVSGPAAASVIAGNRVALSTNFTAGGSTHTIAAIDLAVNNFYSRFPVEAAIEDATSDFIKGLPDMQGSGMVRSMHAAASTSSAFSQALDHFARSTSRSEQLAEVDQLISLTRSL